MPNEADKTNELFPASTPRKEVKMYDSYQWDNLASCTFFASVKLPNGETASFNLRYNYGMEPEKFYEWFKGVYQAMDMMTKDHDVKIWAGGKQSEPAKPETPPAPAAPSTPSGSNGHKHNSKDPLPASEIPHELSGLEDDVYSTDFDYFVIEPKPEGKSVVKFFKDNLEFPVGATMNQWKHETIKEALAQLTDKEISPKEAEKYRVAGVQYFVLGNEYVIQQGSKKGKKSRYKNLKLLKPIF